VPVLTGLSVLLNSLVAVRSGIMRRLISVVRIAGSTGLPVLFVCSFWNPADSHDLILWSSLRLHSGANGTPAIFVRIFVSY
jgi:hypothetical protein